MASSLQTCTGPAAKPAEPTPATWPFVAARDRIVATFNATDQGECLRWTPEPAPQLVPAG